MKEIKKLTSEQYWEWCYRIGELKSSDILFKKIMLEYRIKELELDIKKKEIILFKDLISKNAQERDKIKDDYEFFRSSLSDKVGIDLKNCVIDPISYEIKKV